MHSVALQLGITVTCSSLLIFRAQLVALNPASCLLHLLVLMHGCIFVVMTSQRVTHIAHNTVSESISFSSEHKLFFVRLLTAPLFIPFRFSYIPGKL